LTGPVHDAKVARRLERFHVPSPSSSSSGTSPTPVLRIVPLGGLGEIGMNCLAIEYGDHRVVVDCGVTFPDAPFGTNLIHPDFSYLTARKKDFRAIVVTHGHEDHIGAIPFLLRQANVPVYGPGHALELVRTRLEEDGPITATLIETSPRKTFDIGPFRFDPIRVTHSIADATALAIETPAGTVIHTGDFKIEDDPLDGEEFDEDAFRSHAERGVRLLLSDSTNSFTPGFAGREEDVAHSLEKIIAGHPGRVIVALFASNVHRLRSLFDIARREKRRVVLLGRSLRRHVETAVKTDYLEDQGDLLVHPDDAQLIPPRELMVLATGTQGEPPAALARLAARTHPALLLDRGDRVIMSSRVIPGNDRPVHAIIDELIRLGVEVRFRGTDPDVHASGHAHVSEQKKMIELVRPRAFVPVHGTRAHLERHAALARTLGIEDVLVIENGSVIEVHPDRLVQAGSVPVGRVHVDQASRVVSDDVLRDRGALAEAGAAFVVLELDQRGTPKRRPRVRTRGVLPDGARASLLDEAAVYVADDLASARGNLDDDAASERARGALRRFFRRELGSKPVCEAFVVRR
jgi:ribonuclease J